MRPAGFWLRFGAHAVDAFALFVIGMAAGQAINLAAPSKAAAVVLQLASGTALSAAYYTLLTSAYGATWGKRAFGLRVTDVEGNPVSVPRALLRWCAYFPSYLLLGVGFMMAGWNAEKMALHDYAAQTRVVRTEGGGAGGLKILLGLLGALFLAAVAGTAALVPWLQRQRRQLEAEKPAIEANAVRFARGSDQHGCVKEALSQPGEGVLDESRHALFLGVCLAAAAPSPDFCRDVPAQASILASSLWAVDACRAYGRPGDQPCARLLRSVQRHCAAASSAAPSGPAPPASPDAGPR